ncbi:MAG TPA: hypothetical protein VJP45_08395 [Candidatus Limnocylindria bacterium]|nr:hypothetical protein [Candidatus Limnocylindria bacterium]
MVDHLPVGTEAQRPPPRQATLALLVGRITTIKLAYWAAITVFELAIRLVLRMPDERFVASVVFAALATLVALIWARHAARAVDARVGALPRSIPTIATTFVAASVVASPASLPLLLVERQRSIEDCPGSITCHPETLWLWVVTLAVGFIIIPAVFAASLRSSR